MGRLRHLVVGAVLAVMAEPAAAQTSDETRDALRLAAPRAREHCLQRAAGRDAALLDCLHFRAMHPVRDWNEATDNAEARARAGLRTQPARTRVGVQHPDPAERYFPRLGEQPRFDDADPGDIERCRGQNGAAAAARDTAVANGHAVIDYRLRVLAMTPAQIAAEQARVREVAPSPDVDPVLARRLPAFLMFAGQIVSGHRVYRSEEDDLVPALDRMAATYQAADKQYRAAMDRCIAAGLARPVEPERPVAAIIPEATGPTAWMTGTFDTGGGVMTLDPSGGRYEAANGRLSVTRISGTVMEGRWEQDSSGQRCADGGYWGRFRLTFTETGFTGLFGYCLETPAAQGGFYGTRRRARK